MRNPVFDIEKAIAAYFVIFLHIRFPEPVGTAVNTIARFAVPLFFMISGYFSWYPEGEGTKDRYIRKLRHIGTLTAGACIFYLLWEVLYALLEKKDPAALLSSWFTWEKIKDFLLFQYVPFKWHLWFLPSLFLCCLAAACLRQRKQQKAGYLLILPLLGLHFILEELDFLWGGQLKTCMVRNAWLTGFPCFFLGMWVRSRKETKVSALWTIRPGCLLALAAAGALCSLGERYFLGKSELYLGSMVCAFCLLLAGASHRMKKAEGFPGFLETTGKKDALLLYLLHPFAAQLLGILQSQTTFFSPAVYGWIRPLLTALACTFAAWFYRRYLHPDTRIL